jgi:hypothetical protein
MLSLGPSPRLLHGPPDVRGSLGRAGIAGEVVVFKGAFNPVLAHAIGISGDTECYISSGGPGLYLIEVRNRSRDRFDNLRPLWGERELCRRFASRSCSRAR